MRKQFQKIKVAAENLRFNKPDKNSDELQCIEKQCDRYKDVLQALPKKLVPFALNSIQLNDPILKEKRLKKVQEFILSQTMEESCKELDDGLLLSVLENSAKFEKNLADKIVKNEVAIEENVSQNLNTIYETHIQQLQKQKRIVNKCSTDAEAAKQKYQSANQVQQQNPQKTTLLKDDQDECEQRLEKERDIYASMMFELLAEEEIISKHIIHYIAKQEEYYKTTLQEIGDLMKKMQELLKNNKNRKVFNVPLDDHLKSTGRKISYVIELCVCCLLEKGLYEQGLMRVGCAASKLKRMRNAIDANRLGIPVPSEFQDCHVVAAVLKNYLRSLPEPLLTYDCYEAFIEAASKPLEAARKSAILNVIHQLPDINFNNLKYLTKFLSLLAEKNQHNKMSSQNLAIVMSPNLLWPHTEDDTNYSQQVHSTAAVNTIVDALISDWSYFFDGDVDFYVTMTRDALFPDNGGFPVDKEQPTTVHNLPPASGMSQSMNAAIGGSLLTANANYSHFENNASSRSHSRSNSHDTSLILYPDSMAGGGGYSGGIGDKPKNSLSNSSLSDQSSPVQGSSPKLPKRKKHNKPVAPPVPPVETPKKSQILTGDNLRFKEQNPNAGHGPQPGMQMTTEHSNLVRASSTDNLTAKVKPPRPVNYVLNSQTLNRAPAKGQKPETQVKPDTQAKPIALPRSVGAPPPKPPPPHLQDDEVGVLMRDKEKPAIPDRPASLMRPPSFKGSVPEITKVDKCESTSAGGGGGGIKKAQSFRSDQKSSNAQHNLGHTERTQMYNIDKKQVAIIDVVDRNNRTAANKFTLDLQLEKENTVEMSQVLSSSHTDLSMQHVPPSPRGFDPKVKRPQIPAPPPPRPIAPTADSTNL